MSRSGLLMDGWLVYGIQKSRAVYMGMFSLGEEGIMAVEHYWQSEPGKPVSLAPSLTRVSTIIVSGAGASPNLTLE